jgi:hypothetical protein
MACMAGPFCGVCRGGGRNLLSEPPRRMKSERKGRCPGTARRPQPSASEDRVRTGAQPAALDSGPCELCVGQEAASKADAPDPPRHAPRPGTCTGTCAPTRQRHADTRPRAYAFLCTAEASKQACYWVVNVAARLAASPGQGSPRKARHARLLQREWMHVDARPGSRVSRLGRLADG